MDHEIGLLEVTKRFLEKDPRISEVIITDSPEKALELALEGIADVMVSDYEMPGMNGLELLRRMRSLGCDIPFILFTGRGKESVVIEALDSGADFYIQKGGDPQSQFRYLAQKMNISYERFNQKRELDTFLDIVRGMDTAIVVIHIDEKDIWSSNIQSLNQASKAMFPSVGFNTYPTLREIGDGPLSPILHQNIDRLISVFESGVPYHIEELVITEEPPLVCNVRVMKLPNNRVGVLLDDITGSWLTKRNMQEAARRTLKQRKAALELITDDAVAKANDSVAFHRIAEIVCEGLEVSRVGVWLIDEKRRSMRRVSLFSSSEGHSPIVVEPDMGPIKPYIKNIKKGNILKVDDAFNDPRCECLKYKYLLDEDVRSFLDVGITIDGKLRGMICAESLGSIRNWNDDEELFLENVSARVSQMLTAMDRERIRQELDESHELLRYIVENVPASIAVHDKELNYLYVSNSYIEQFGLQGQDLIGRHHYEVFPDLPQKWKDVHQRVLKGARESQDIDEYEREDGSKNWTRWECFPWYEPDGSIGGLIVFTEIIDKWLADQERLRESEEMFRLIADNIWDNVTFFDLDFNVKYISNNIKALRGHTPEEAVELSLQDVLTPESYAYAMALFKEAFEAERNGLLEPDHFLSFEVDQYHKDGHILHLGVKAGFIRDKDLQPKGILTLTHDLTESKDIRKRLASSLKRQETILAASGCGTWEVHLDTHSVFRSPEYYTMLGYEPFEDYASESKGPDGHWLNLIHPDDRENALRYSDEYIASNSNGMYENTYRMLKADGTWAHIKSRGRRLVDDRGMLTPIFFGIHIDVSGEAEVRRSLEESSLRLEDIINHLPDPTMVMSRDGEIWYWNNAIEDLTGRPWEGMVGKGNHEYAIPFYGERRPILANLALEADLDLESKYPAVVRHKDILITDDVPVVMNGQPRYLWAMARPIYDLEGNAIGAIESVRDVTEKKIVKDALLRVNRQLTLMTSLTRHDVLNQTMALSGFLQLMKDRPEMLNENQIGRLLSITEKITEQIRFTTIYDEIGSKDPQWYRLMDLLPGREEFGDIVLECDIDGIEIFGDPMISRVFSNLLDNSIRHGGDVSVIHVSQRMDDGDLVITWEDDGVGVPTAEKSDIFERGRGRNTGFGLYISRDILSITGLSITETGKEGKGARFEIRVPMGAFRSEKR